MKKFLKKGLAVLAAVATAFQLAAVPALAEGTSTTTLLLDSELREAVSGVTVSGFELTNGQGKNCGYESDRPIYVAKADDVTMTFDAGENGEYTSAEIKVTYHANKAWIVEQDDYRNGGLVELSNDGETWTNASGVSFDTPTVSGSFKTTVLSFAMQGSRYIRMNGHVKNDVFGAWNFMIHGAKLNGTGGESGDDPEPPTPTLLLDSELREAVSGVTVSGFEIKNGEGAHCGYESDRPIYVAMSNDATMTFDAGENGEYTSAEIKVTYHGNKAWIVEQDNYRNGGLVQLSNDGETWTNATGITYSEPTTNDNFKTTVLSFEAGNNRYIRIVGKVNGDAFGAWCFMVHNAKIYGTGGQSGDDSEPQTPTLLLDSDLSSAVSGVSVSGFEIKEGEGAHCGYESDRPIYVAMSNDATMTFDAGENGEYTSAEIKVTYHGNKAWIVEQDNYRNGGLVQLSNDGETWTNATGITYSEPTINSNFKTTVLSFEAGNNRYIRINGKVSGDAFGAWGFMVHNAKLYGIGGESVDDPDVNPDADPEADFTWTDTCITPSVTKNDYVTAEYTDMKSVNWNLDWIGRSDTYLVSNENPNITDTITYSLKSGANDLVYAKIHMVENGDRTPKVSATRNGITQSAQKGVVRKSSTPLTAVGSQGLSDSVYLAVIPANMKSITLEFSGDYGNYRILDITLGISASSYAYDSVDFTDTPTAAFANNKWNVSGKLDFSAAGTQTVTAILCVYKNGKMLSMTEKEISLTEGGNSFSIGSSEIADTDTEAVLYIWDSKDGMTAVISSPINFD